MKVKHWCFVSGILLACAAGFLVTLWPGLGVILLLSSLICFGSWTRSIV